MNVISVLIFLKLTFMHRNKVSFEIIKTVVCIIKYIDTCFLYTVLLPSQLYSLYFSLSYVYQYTVFILEYSIYNLNVSIKVE